MARPENNNNPFALIQPKPDKWRGLIKAQSDGFLTFDTPRNGVRAGFINLYNAYIKRGLNTIEKIFPVYAPAGHGNNNPESYIKTVSTLSGIPRGKEITTTDELYKIGRAIVKVENGSFWVPIADFNAGFADAKNAVNMEKLINATIISGGAVIVLLLLILTYAN